MVAEFAFAAKQAMKAGFDGVELHSGNGYIFQQFLATSVNQRGDTYSGSIEGRSKFLLETVCQKELSNSMPRGIFSNA